MESFNWNEFAINQNINVGWNSFISNLRKIGEEVVPTFTVNSRNKEWFDLNCKKLMNQKRRNYLKYKNGLISLKELKSLKNQILLKLKYKKHNYQQSLLNDGNPKKIFKYINSKIASPRSIPCIKNNGEVLSSKDCSEQFGTKITMKDVLHSKYRV